MKKIFALLVLLLAVEGWSREVRFENLTDGVVRVQASGTNGLWWIVRESGVMEWPDGEYVVTSDFDATPQTVTVGGSAPVDRVHVVASREGTVSGPLHLVAENEMASADWFGAGFGLGLTFWGFGWVLRIVKKSVHHSVD